MTTNPKAISVQHDRDQASLRGYVIGFVSSIVLTLSAYFLATSSGPSRDVKIFVLAALALTQFMVQLIYFLHLGREFKPRWKLAVFLFMIGVVVILVAGSLWIMTNLSTRMSPAQQIKYLNDQDGL